jgi:flagellar biosynthesis chaperone FliJ
MARDPLQVLARLRGISLDQARRALADRLREEAAAEARRDGIAATIVREAQMQERQAVESRTVDAYAAWVGRMRDAQHDAQTVVQACTAATGEARTSLSEARAGTRVLEAAMARTRETRRAAAVRREQEALDEAAAWNKRKKPPSE